MPGEIVRHAADDAGVVRVVLRHEGRLNAMTRAMWRALRRVFEDIQHGTDARCVLLEGEGDAFCAGGDISEYPSFRFDAAQLRDFHEVEVWGGLAAMLACDVPIVAAIRGACMGAGVEIASCCDIRMAEEGARFGAPIARLGFPMAPRETALVATRVGDGVARQMLLQAAIFDAAQMLAHGFVSCVVTPDALAQEANDSARRIAALAPQAARMNKRTLRVLSDKNSALTLADASQKAIFFREIDAYAWADSTEHREGITAFLEKRKPRF